MDKMNQDRFAIDGHKLYWHLDRVVDWQKGRLIAPIYVEISPVSFCNNKCVFCGVDFARDGLALEAGALMKRLGEMGKLGVRSIMVAGEGEPLLHPRISEIVTHAKACGMDVSIATNGMAGETKIWESLLPSLTWIRFSVDAATPQVHASVHGVPPAAFERTIASLKEAVRIKKERNLPVTIGVQFLMIRENLCDIEKALPLYSDMGVDYLSFKPYSEHPHMHHKSGFIYSQEMILGIEATVRKFSAKGKTAILFRKLATDAYAEGTPKFSKCCATSFWGHICSKGDFYTCGSHLKDERFRAGNIYADSMDSIFFGDVRKRAVAFAEQTLDVARECRLNCRMARINEFLDFLKREPDHINFI